MKKRNSIYALLSAIALTGVMGISSCSSKDDVADNPNYDPVTNTVNVEVAMSISTKNTPSTRMTDASTQATGTSFRGIQDAFILTHGQESDGKHVATAMEIDKIYDLNRLVEDGDISGENSRRVLEMTLPLNTNTMMVYGRAMEGTPSSAETAAGLTAYDVFGHLRTADGYHVEQDLSKVKFIAARRLSTENLTDYQRVDTLLAGVLTCIMNTNLAGTNHVAISATEDLGTGVHQYGQNVSTDEYNEVYWSSYGSSTDTSPAIGGQGITPLEQKLRDAYKEMTSIQVAAGELRCGAGKNLERTLKDLWSVVNSVRCANPTSKAEIVAKCLAVKIHLHMQAYLNSDAIPSDGAAVTNVKFKSTAEVISAFNSDTAWPTTANTKPTDLTPSVSVNLGDFPHNFHLPAGATHLAFDTTKKKFSYVEKYNTTGMPTTTQTFTVESYYFPPELLYFGNSPIRVSSTEYKTNQYPQTVSAWDNDATWGAIWEKNNHVQSNTRSVAMINDINYGTALLKTQVGYKFDETTPGVNKLYDNNHAIQDAKSNHTVNEPDKVITVNGTSFKLKGVLIGGQSKAVGWNYLPVKVNSADEGITYGYVYDCAVTSGSIPTTGLSEPNYTLAFDNYSTGASQDRVYVALELENNSGEDFFGLHNLIPQGGDFYLIGELNPAKTGLDPVTWPAHHPLPPYNADGTSIQTTRVFMQDYMTTANFKIGKTSLQKAYLTVPDLRSTSLTLGLSVDIQWSTGLNFSEVILGEVDN